MISGIPNILDFVTGRRFSFTCEAHPTGLDVLHFSGVEGIGRLFEFQVTLVSARSDIAFDEVVNKPATLTINGRAGSRRIRGILTAFELVRIHERHAIYHATLAPPHARLRLRRSLRIFSGQTTRQIVEQVLQEHEIKAEDLEWKLRETYLPRDYCVQYRETDLDFVSRLLEEEGIAYHFEEPEPPEQEQEQQQEQGEQEQQEEKELLTVFCDNARAREPIAGVPLVIYKEDRTMVTDQEAVFDFTYTQQMCSGAVELRDYSFKKPAERVGGTAKGEAVELEVYDYPGEFVDSQLGGRLAMVRLQELEQERLTASGASDCTRLVPGLTFTLGGKVRRHPRADLNQGYLLTIVRHEGEQPHVLEEEGSGEGSRYHNSFSVVPAKVEWRPPRVAPRPRVLGTQTATVVGPAGEEIYTDRYGRVKVHFHWDRAGAASCWCRVSQSWAGAGFGLFFLPRVGQEVLVRFIDGDPDRPLITGKVYNGQQKPPYQLPANKSRSVIKSSSSPGGGGSNELRFEDSAGGEEIYVHAAHDYTQVVHNDQTTTIGQDRHELVEAGEQIFVSNDRSVTVAETSSHEADKLRLKSAEKIRLVVGPSSVELTPDSIKLCGPKIDLEAEGSFTIIGAPVKLDGAASEAEAEEKKKKEEAERQARLAAARKLIDVRGSADQADAELVAQELARMPLEDLQFLDENGHRVVVCRGSVTEYRTDLAGVRPRGWPEGSTWDTVPGLNAGDETVVATVGHGTEAGAHVPQSGEGHGSYNMVLHEAAHGLDSHGGGRSNDADFLAARTADAGNLEDYLSQDGVAGRQETFAETYAQYHGGDPTLQTDLPNLYNYYDGGP
jgi:type VI secretion system secreted protein VgrG